MAAMPAPRPSVEDRIRAALWFAERGFAVFSVWSTDPDGTCRCTAKAACDQPGKHPVPSIGFKAATTDPNAIRAMLSAGSDPNWGMLPPEGVFALDVDGDGVPRLKRLEADHGPLPPTLRTNTAHGQHVFLRWPEHLPRPIGQLFGYVTRWGSGSNTGYVIGPRSVHASGAVYAPAEGSLEIATLPEAWARAAVAPAAHETVITVGGSGYVLPEPGYDGVRYDAIRDYIASRYMRGMSRDEVWAGVRDVLAPRFAQPLPEADLLRRFERAWKGTPDRLGTPAGERPAPERPGPENDLSVLLSSISTDPPPPLLAERLDPTGHTILYGTGGVGKGALACRWIADLVQDGHRVLVVDYEGHPEEWSRRIASLAPDVHRSDAVRHVAPRHPIGLMTDVLAWTCETYDLDYLVIDSAVMACGTDPLKPEAAAAYAAALVAINRPVLSLAHVTKADDPRYPFGSVFWHNLARMTWSLTGTDGETLLRHRKHNNYASLGTFALTMTWHDGLLSEVWERGYNMTVLRRAMDALEGGVGLTLDEILAAINDDEHKAVSRRTLQRTLSRALVNEVRLDAAGKYTRV